jgi:Protein of unknown function (DUF2971)
MIYFDSPDVLHDKYVYHYTKLSTALEFILPSGTIKISALQNVNDLRESQDWHFSGRGASDMDFKVALQFMNECSRLIKENVRVFCTVQDKPHRDGRSDWHRGYCRPRMWSQYGDNHKGICLVFDKDKLNSAIRAALPEDFWIEGRAVVYQDDDYLRDDLEAFSLDLDRVNATSLEYATDFMLANYFSTYFFIKNADWSGEQEWRWVVKGKGDRDIFLLFQDSLSGLIVGPNMPDVYLDTIKSLAIKYGIERNVAKLRWFDRTAKAYRIWLE